LDQTKKNFGFDSFL